MIVSMKQYKLEKQIRADMERVEPHGREWVRLPNLDDYDQGRVWEPPRRVFVVMTRGDD